MKLTAKNLKDQLWETLQAVKSGEMSPKQADSIASQSREMTRIGALQLRVAQQTGQDVPKDLVNFSEG